MAEEEAYNAVVGLLFESTEGEIKMRESAYNDSWGTIKKLEEMEDYGRKRKEPEEVKPGEKPRAPKKKSWKDGLVFFKMAKVFVEFIGSKEFKERPQDVASLSFCMFLTLCFTNALKINEKEYDKLTEELYIGISRRMYALFDYLGKNVFQEIVLKAFLLEIITSKSVPVYLEHRLESSFSEYGPEKLFRILLPTTATRYADEWYPYNLKTPFVLRMRHLLIYFIFQDSYKRAPDKDDLLLLTTAKLTKELVLVNYYLVKGRGIEKLPMHGDGDTKEVSEKIFAAGKANELEAFGRTNHFLRKLIDEQWN